MPFGALLCPRHQSGGIKRNVRLTVTCLQLKNCFSRAMPTVELPLLLHPFNDLFPKTTWVSWHQKGKPFWILLEQEMMGWQWHQLDHMQIFCALLQTDNHASTSPLCLL